MKSNNVIKPLLGLFLLILAPQVHAYIGPGLGLGMAAVVLGVFAALVLLLLGLVLMPIKRLIRKRKDTTAESSNTLL